MWMLDLGGKNVNKNSIKEIENNFIPDFPCNKNFDEYYESVIKDFHIVKDYFPLLQITSLPTVKAKEIFITGKLIPQDVLKKCVSIKDIERNSFYILGIYPSEFPKDNMYVEDFYEKINWSGIPDKHKHRRIYVKNKRIVLCTHHPDGEINGFKQDFRSVAVLASAWKLYIQCKKYYITNKWLLKDLRHKDEEAIAQLRKLDKYHGK